MDTSRHVRQARESFVDHAEYKFNEIYERTAKFCESEIERIFLAYLIARCVHISELSPGFLYPGNKTLGQLTPWLDYALNLDGGVNVAVLPQAIIGDYRVDFLIAMKSRAGAARNIVIECDGHDYHERTPQQAARDRKRDRELQKQGYQVFRFTGSEINNRPFDCADEIGKLIYDFEYAEAEKIGDGLRPARDAALKETDHE